MAGNIIFDEETLKNRIYNLTLYLDHALNMMTEEEREKFDDYFDALPGFNPSILDEGE